MVIASTYFAKIFGERREIMWEIVESAMIKKGITVYRMAKALNIPISNLYRWKSKGKIPKNDDIVAVSNYLDLDVIQLLQAR